MGDLLWSDDIDIDVKGSSQEVTPNYGRLYNGYAAEHLNIAPAGWHVPSLAEIDTLKAALTTNAGSKIAGNFDLWNDGVMRNSVDFGTAGINLKPAGLRIPFYGFNYTDKGRLVQIWNNPTSTSHYINEASTALNEVAESADSHGHSLLLIKDDSNLVASFKDYDGNVYGAVKIGTQVWATDLFACTKLNNGIPIAEIQDNTSWGSAIAPAYSNYNNIISSSITVGEAEIIGDLKSGDNTLTQVEDIMLATKGQFFWSPTLGYGAKNKINSNINPVVTQGEIINELKKEGIEYDSITVDNGNIDLQINGKNLNLSSE